MLNYGEYYDLSDEHPQPVPITQKSVDALYERLVKRANGLTFSDLVDWQTAPNRCDPECVKQTSRLVGAVETWFTHELTLPVSWYIDAGLDARSATNKRQPL